MAHAIYDGTTGMLIDGYSVCRSVRAATDLLPAVRRWEENAENPGDWDGWLTEDGSGPPDYQIKRVVSLGDRSGFTPARS